MMHRIHFVMTPNLATPPKLGKASGVVEALSDVLVPLGNANSRRSVQVAGTVRDRDHAERDSALPLNFRIFKNARWIDQILILHLFDHPRIRQPHAQRVMQNVYLNEFDSD